MVRDFGQLSIQYAPATDASFLLWLCAGLGLLAGAVVGVTLWFDRGTARHASLAVAFVIAQIPLVQLGEASDAGRGIFVGAFWGFAIFSQLLVLPCALLATRDARASALGLSMAAMQGGILAIFVGAWLGVAWMAGFLAIIWACYYASRRFASVEQRLEAWLEARIPAATAVLIFAQPMMVAALLWIGGAQTRQINRHVVEAVHLETLTLAAWFAVVLALSLEARRQLPKLQPHARAVLNASVLPVAFWLVFQRLEQPNLPELATWGFIMATASALVLLFSSWRSEVEHHLAGTNAS
jgi:hypothetical protein